MKKEDFIVGDWYKSEYSNYFKFLKFENNYFYSSQQIYNKIWEERRRGRGGEWVRIFLVGYDVCRINLSEIQEYLPDNHPDRIINDVPIIKENNDYLIEFLNNLNIK